MIAGKCHLQNTFGRLNVTAFLVARRLAAAIAMEVEVHDAAGNGPGTVHLGALPRDQLYLGTDKRWHGRTFGFS